MSAFGCANARRGRSLLELAIANSSRNALTAQPLVKLHLKGAIR